MTQQIDKAVASNYNRPTMTVLVTLIALLSSFAACLGVFWSAGGSSARYDFKTLHHQTAAIQGAGLYRMDTVSGAAQEIGQDVVTLVVGVPLLGSVRNETTK